MLSSMSLIVAIQDTQTALTLLQNGYTFLSTSRKAVMLNCCSPHKLFDAASVLPWLSWLRQAVPHFEAIS